MALSAQNSNFISELTTKSEMILDLQREIDVLVARWNQNDMFNALTDVDIQAVAAFAHLTKSEVSNAVNAVTAVSTALGDLTTGQAVNLLKMKG
jgi:plasmid maintenance system antidote protein VapI